jgi:penicillin-insensitive murein endopeptidase
MVDTARQQPSPAFASGSARMVELTARDTRVDRLFLNPVLKRALCASTAGDRSWLRKVRPWWGHADHIHVRLACPADSPECQAQAPLPPGDGCDSLAWWFDTKAQDERNKDHQSYTAKVGAMPSLPPGCDALIAP